MPPKRARKRRGAADSVTATYAYGEDAADPPATGKPKPKTLCEIFAHLQGDTGPNELQLWNSAMRRTVSRAEREGKEVHDALMTRGLDGRLADGSMLVKSSLGYPESSSLSYLEHPSLIQMMLGLAAANGDHVTEEEMRERISLQMQRESESSAARAPTALPSRPEASTLLSRFDAAATEDPLAGQSEVPALARLLGEARCEVSSDFLHGDVRCLAAAGPALVLAGATGYKHREPWAKRFAPKAIEPRSLAECAAAALVGAAEPASLEACASALSGSASGSVLEQMTQYFEVEESYTASDPAAVKTLFSSSVRSAAVDPHSGLTWLGEACGRRFKAFDAEGRCCYTLDSPSTDALAVAAHHGARVLVAPGGAGKLAFWNTASLDARTGGVRQYRGEGPWRERVLTLQVLEGSEEADVLSFSDAEGVCWLEEVEGKVDVTRGEAPHATRTVEAGEHANSFSAICDVGDGKLALAANGRSRGDGTLNAEVIAVFDVAAGRTSRLFGHVPAPGGYIRQVNALSSAPELAGTLASGCSDGTVKIWDVRARRPTHTLLGLEDSRTEGIAAVALVAGGGGGWPFVFSSSPDAAIKLWDLRASGRCLYELATGNARVDSLVWHSDSRTLLAVAERGEAPRSGGWGGDSDEEPEDEDWDAWPTDARHREDDFGVRWDLPHSGSSVVLQYRFKGSPAQPSRTMKSYFSKGNESVAKWRSIGEAYACRR